MKAAVNLKHPRSIIDGEPRPIPLCIDCGSLVRINQNILFGLDDCGIAVSIYFKLLKSFIIFYTLLSLMCVPLYYMYSCGEMSKQATGAAQTYLSEWMLGNLGESSEVCKQKNLRLYDTLTLWCPSGTKI